MLARHALGEADVVVYDALVSDAVLALAHPDARLEYAGKRGGKPSPWLAKMIANKPTKVAAVALANKNARVAWVLLRHGGTYQKPATIAAD